MRGVIDFLGSASSPRPKSGGKGWERQRGPRALQRAGAHETLGDRSLVVPASLARALALAEAEGAIRLFVDQGPPMARRLVRRLRPAASRRTTPLACRPPLPPMRRSRPAARLSPRRLPSR